MAQTTELKAAVRSIGGKGAARAVRRQGLIPAVIYGDKEAPQAISLEYKPLWMHYQKGKFLSTVINVDVAGKKVRVIPRDIQLDPVKDFPIHVDFQRIGANSIVRVGVPVLYTGHDKSPGLKRGGILNIVRREVEVFCPADAIPANIVVDLEGTEIGRSIHISAVTLPEGVRTVIQGRDFTLATIAGAKAEEEAKPAGEGDAAAATTAAGEGAAAPEAAKSDDKAKK